MSVHRKVEGFWNVGSNLSARVWRIATRVRQLHNLGSVARLAQANVLLASVQFLTGIVLARALGPEARGELANLILWPTLLCHFALCGVHLHLARETARKPSSAAANYKLARRALSACVSASTVIYCIILAVFVRFGGFLPNVHLALIAVLMLPSSMWCMVQLHMELGRQNTKTFNSLRYAYTLPYFCLVVVLWGLGAVSVAVYLIAFLVAGAFAALAADLAIARGLRARADEGPPAAETVRRLLSEARPYGLAVALNALSHGADKMLVSLFFDARVMGLYVVAATISQLQDLAGEAISQLFFSKVARNETLADVDKAWLGMRLRQAIAIYAALSGVTLIVAPHVLRLIFGAKFNDSADFVYFLIPTFGMRSVTRPFEEILKGGGRPMDQSRIMIVTTVAFVLSGGLSAWLGSIPLMLSALFGTSLMAFYLISKRVASEAGVGVNDLILPRRADFSQIFQRLLTAIRS